MAQPRIDPKLDSLNPRGRLRTLLLYCPFDRRVTRHARRGNELRLVCLDCGRSLDQEPGEAESGTTIDLSTPAPASSSYNLPSRAASGEHAMARPSALNVQRRPRPAPPTPEPRPSTARRSTRKHARTSPRVLLAGAAAVLVVLGGANLVGQLVRQAPPAAPPPAIRVVTDSASPSVTVANTEGIGVYLRATPTMNDFLYPVAEGAELQIAGPDLWADGIHWLQVEDGSGGRAWVPASYTSLAS